jgi:hypothetical protein
MNKDEIKAAFLEGVPVVHRGIEYVCISALIYRRSGGKLLAQVELHDKCNHSVTIAQPERVARA